MVAIGVEDKFHGPAKFCKPEIVFPTHLAHILLHS
jgi:hypothetical protein